MHGQMNGLTREHHLYIYHTPWCSLDWDRRSSDQGRHRHRAPAFEGIGSDLIREAALEALSESSDAVQAQRSSEKARKGNRPLVSLQAALEGMSRMTCKHPSHEDGGAMNNRHPVNTLPTPCLHPADITETETETQTETETKPKPKLKPKPIDTILRFLRRWSMRHRLEALEESRRMVG